MFAAAALYSGTAFASPTTNTAVDVSTFASNQHLADKVASEIRKYPYYGIFDWVTGYTRDGVVTLEGAIYQPGRKDDYMRLAAKVAGVKSVVNNIHMLPNSPFDDSLRLSAARAIYRNPDFLQIAIQPNPPVHIVVSNGTIHLEGIVRNNMERQLAETAVRSRTLAFEVVNDLKTES
jgi:hyperosmotically inducible protein